MSTVEFLICDCCKKIADTDNHYKAGWIALTGSLTRGNGKYNKKRGCYLSQYIAAPNTKHFCSWKCLESYDENNKKI